MTLKILESAREDLQRGRRFYERQGGRSLGEYFFDSLFSDIDSLILYGGIHPVFFGGIFECFPKGFLMRFITNWMETS